MSKLTVQIIFTLLVFTETVCMAQVLPANAFSVSYYGEFVKHPGLSVDISQHILPYKNKQITIDKVRNLITTGIRLSVYSHPKSHLGISLTPQIGYQFLFNSGLIARLNGGAGYLRQFNYGSTYEVTGSNEVKKVQLAGRNKFTTNFSVGFGQNLMKRKDIRWGWHFDIGVFTEAPTNTGFIPHLFVKTGIDYYINIKKRHEAK